MKINKNRKQFLKYSLLVTCSLFLIIVGEVINALNNPEQRLIPLLIKLTKENVIKNDCKKSLFFLNLSSHLLIRKNSHLYKNEKVYEKGREIHPGDINSTSKKIIFDELQGFYLNIQMSNPIETISFINYKLFLKFYSEGNFTLASNFIDKAVLTNPSLPQYQLERINFYLLLGEKNKAENATKLCQLHDIPKIACGNFYNELISIPDREVVGFNMESAIEHLTQNTNFTNSTK